MVRTRLPALLLALGLVLAACSSGPGSSDAIDYHKVAPPRRLGSGFLVAAAPGGSALYVSDPSKGFPQPGCEGMPESVLFRQPVKGGPRELLDNGGRPLKGVLVRGPGGRLALVDLCENIFTGLKVGRESAGGRITDLKDLTLGFDKSKGTPAPYSFSWTGDGRSILAAINDLDAPDGGPTRLVRIDPATGVVTDLFTGDGGTGVFQFAQLAGGTYVVASNLVVTFRNARGARLATFPGNGFEMTPDRKGVVIFGNTLSTASEGDRKAKTVVGVKKGYEMTSASISPDGTAVAFIRYSHSTGKDDVAIVTLADGKLTPVASGDGLGGPIFTGDGQAVVFNEFVTHPNVSPGLLVARLGG